MGVTRPTGWGFWGSGRVSHQAGQDLQFVTGSRLVVAGSRRLDAAQRLASAHRGCVPVDSLAQLIDHPDVSAVYIATPDACHRDDVLAVMASGKAVLCEKPLATSLSDVQVLVAAASRQQSFLMEAMWTRFLPAILDVKRVVEAGEIGDIRYMQGRFSYGDVRRGHQGYPTLAQSLLYDRGIYLVALAQWLKPGDASTASGRCLEWTHDGSPRALCRFELQWTDGTLLDAMCGNSSDLINTFDIVGTRGTISIPDPFFKAHAYNVRAPQAAGATDGAVAQRDSSTAVALARAKKLKRRWQPLSAALHTVRSGAWNFPGNGYQFEFEEVARCLATGRSQSERMSWDHSLALARSLDMISRACEANAR